MTKTPRMNMTRTTRLQLVLSLSLVVGILACTSGNTPSGGTPTPPPKTIATQLDYATASGTYTLAKDASSTATHLVLNLLGPAGSGTGVGFVLSADTTKVSWAKPASSDADLARNGLFDLGTTLPKLSVAKATGNQLQVAFFQKGTTKPAVTLTPTSVLATVALDLASSNLPVGTVISLTAVAGKAVLTQGASAPLPIVITPGTITAN